MCCLLHHNAAWQGSDLALVKIEEGNVSPLLLKVSGTCSSNITAVMQITSRVLTEGKWYSSLKNSFPPPSPPPFRMEEKIGRCVVSFVSFIPLVCIGRCKRLTEDLDVQGGHQQISRCRHEKGIQVNFTYQPADSQRAIDPKLCLLLANWKASKKRDDE